MPKLISKLQHKNYETGEFSDEKARDLDETISLIKAFPWEDERHLTDIQLTGPSVTICNEAGEYLKIGLYFNHKFALYYINRKEKLHEFYTADIEEVTLTVHSFFQDTLPIKLFNRKHFSFNSKKHFSTRDFTYEFNIYLWWLKILFGGLFTMFFLWTGLVIMYNYASIFAIFCIIPAVVLYRDINHYLYSKGIKIIISKGKDHFYLYTATTKNKLYKRDIEKVIVSEIPFSRHPARLCSEIIFKDGRSIKLSSLVIQPLTLASKLKNAKVEYKYDYLPLLNKKSTDAFLKTF
ncbi:hypothetical protein LJ707_08955 [Mucilaginibacter sp. UR6-1]|uniref:hypothetical protein n=1 Tax=Mucilaginibacter sp. UR6-1 TaxID=1435643 RepID=UPI001E29A5B0|nr:hypothetical protein [Mucilaginibacter sp. UR6-1]MCC8409058.1 hypothetical protein [Mucilaginibacter sp. UR6-1]